MAKRATTSGTSAPKTTRSRATKKTAPAVNPASTTAAAVEAVSVDTENATAALVTPVAEEAVVATPAVAEAPAVETAVVVEAPVNGNGHHHTTEQIAKMAYFFWQQRGCPIGSADEDWLRAERELSQGKAAYAGH